MNRAQSVEAGFMDYEITPEALKSLLESGDSDVIVLDVREPWEIETASLAGSTNIPRAHLMSRAARRR